METREVAAEHRQSGLERERGVPADVLTGGPSLGRSRSMCRRSTRREDGAVHANAGRGAT